MINKNQSLKKRGDRDSAVNRMEKSTSRADAYPTNSGDSRSSVGMFLAARKQQIGAGIEKRFEFEGWRGQKVTR